MSGTLHLVGVGPGDPELLTFRAARVIAAAHVVAYPLTGEEGSMALDIARAHVAPDALYLPVTIPMSVERAPARAAYAAAAGAIRAHLDAGRDVAWLCEGDPLFYGTAMYLLPLLAEHTVDVVPGVTSLTAAAALVRQPLAARNEVLKILPAPLADDLLRAELAESQSIAIIKIGRHFDRVRALLDEAGRAAGAWVIEHATGPKQKLARLADYGPGDRPYFSIILSYAGTEFAT